MNDARDISGPRADTLRPSAFEAPLHVGPFWVFLAGMYHVIMSLLGRPMSRAAREAHREQALRLRKTGIATGRTVRSLSKVESHIYRWSGDYGRHWRTRLLAMSIDPDRPDIIFKSRNIVCRLRNAQAKQLRPKHHARAFVALAVMSRPGHDICRSIYTGLSALLSDDLAGRAVRAPP